MNAEIQMTEPGVGSFPDLMSRARHGKIARLPLQLREEVNRRLDGNQSGVKILAWINAQPEAKQVLERQFGGKPINLQNLSNWRREGFAEWLRYRFAADMVDRQVAASPGQSLQEAVIDPLERVLAVECMAAYQKATESSDPSTKFKRLCEVLHEINAMRRHEHRKAWRELQAEKESYEFERFCRTRSGSNQSPSSSNQSQSHQIKLDQGVKKSPESRVQSPESATRRGVRVAAFVRAQQSNVNLAAFSRTQPLVNQGQIQANPGKSEQIKVDQGEKHYSRVALSNIRRPDVGALRARPAGTDLVSSAIAEIFGHQPSAQIQAGQAMPQPNPSKSGYIKLHQ